MMIRQSDLVIDVYALRGLVVWCTDAFGFCFRFCFVFQRVSHVAWADGELLLEGTSLSGKTLYFFDPHPR